MKNLLIIGAGTAGKQVAKQILSNSKLQNIYKIIGFVDDDKNIKQIKKYNILGSIKDINIVISKHEINEVIIAIPSASKDLINRIISSINGINGDITIRIVPGIYEIINGNFSYQEIRHVNPEDLLGREEVGFDLEKISSYYQDKTVFVTGAGGSIGSEIFIQLLQLPVKKVIAFGHGENSVHNLIQKVGKDPRFMYVIGDIKDKVKLEYEINRFNPNIVFHAAAHKHVPLMENYPDEALKNNIIGTYNCAIASINAKVKKFVLVSTDKAVNPTSIMGASKRIAEKIILSLNKNQNNTKLILTRFGNVLGSRGSVIPLFLSQIENKQPITITHPEITRFFMSIREAARLVIKSATVNDGNVFVLDMGKPIKILELAKNLIKISGHNENEIPIVFTGLRPGEKMYEETLTDNENLRKTLYEKLFVSNENSAIMDKEEIEKLIYKTLQTANTFDKKTIIQYIKNYVPEFIDIKKIN